LGLTENTKGGTREENTLSNIVLNSALSKNSSLSPGIHNSMKSPQVNKKEFIVSFLKKLQDKHSKHQLDSAAHMLACLEEADARDSFLRLLPALRF
jgi:hypothetical protein